MAAQRTKSEGWESKLGGWSPSNDCFSAFDHLIPHGSVGPEYPNAHLQVRNAQCKNSKFLYFKANTHAHFLFRDKVFLDVLYIFFFHLSQLKCVWGMVCVYRLSFCNLWLDQIRLWEKALKLNLRWPSLALNWYCISSNTTLTHESQSPWMAKKLEAQLHCGFHKEIN